MMCFPCNSRLVGLAIFFFAVAVLSSHALALDDSTTAMPYVPGQARSADFPSPQTFDNITYITGGIGSEERNYMESVQKNYSLRAMIADKTGHLVADSRIVIRSQDGRDVLDVVAGPLFYANLPAGKYIIENFNEGRSKQQTITIGGRPANVHFSW